MFSKSLVLIDTRNVNNNIANQNFESVKIKNINIITQEEKSRALYLSEQLWESFYWTPHSFEHNFANTDTTRFLHSVFSR